MKIDSFISRVCPLPIDKFFEFSSDDKVFYLNLDAFDIKKAGLGSFEEFLIDRSRWNDFVSELRRTKPYETFISYSRYRELLTIKYNIDNLADVEKSPNNLEAESAIDPNSRVNFDQRSSTEGAHNNHQHRSIYLQLMDSSLAMLYSYFEEYLSFLQVIFEKNNEDTLNNFKMLGLTKDFALNLLTSPLAPGLNKNLTRIAALWMLSKVPQPEGVISTFESAYQFFQTRSYSASSKALQFRSNQ